MNWLKKWFTPITLLWAFSIISCDSGISNNPSVPTWEFDITINGSHSHFKSTNEAKEPFWFSAMGTETGAFAVSNGGIWTIFCNGQSAGDDSWIAGTANQFQFSFNETEQTIDYVRMTNGSYMWFGDNTTGKISANLIDFGQKSKLDLSNGTMIFGDPIEIRIPTQTVSNNQWGSITISGTIKAVYN